ncbi:MAG: hypothetical protein AAF213_02400 [Pseudomonadota bacterium]
MSNLSATRRREKRKRMLRRMRMMIFLGCVILAGIAGFQYGQREYVSQEASLKAEIDTLKKAQQDLITGLAQVQADADETKADLADLQAAYERDVPQGDILSIANLATDRLADGVPFERLRFVLSQVTEGDDCGGIEVKRFRPRTPVTPADSVDDIVSFADGSILITGRGEAALDDEQNALFWYDPDQPVAVNIRLLDGRLIPIAGSLPLRHQMVIDGEEHRFNISAGPRSFLLVTYQRCPFP